MTIARKRILREFDNYVRNIVGDDNITEYWLLYGLQDGYTEEDLQEIAEDDELWLDCVKAFARCCEMAGVI